MRRLAVVTIGAIVVTGIGPATAGIGGGDERESWCGDNSALKADVDGPAGVAVVAGVGATRDTPVQTGFACVEGDVGSRYEANALVTGWLDTEYGRAGMSCVRQPARQAVTCRRTSVPLPGRASGRADSAQNQWSFGVLDLGVGLSYDLDVSTTRTATRTSGACVRNVCREESEYRAWADSGAADEPPPDPECREECVTSANRRSSDAPGAGVDGTPTSVAVGEPPSD